MTDYPIPEREDLPNKPLVEAIFELQWELPVVNGNEIDPGFRILLGRLYDRVRNDYPFLENLPQSVISEELTIRIMRHRFRVAKDEWPLVQVGPGIFSVNDTEGYTWDKFRPYLVKAIKALFESYPVDIHKLNITQLGFRYIDAIPFDRTKPLLQFLKESLHTSVELDPQLFKDPQAAIAPNGLNLGLVYELPELPGAVILSFTLGTRDGVQSIMWDTQILARGKDIPETVEEYASWLDKAHDISGQWFRTLSRGYLYESFRRRQ